MTGDRLRWQCRRGMRELDVLLGDWLERHYAAAPAAQKAAFEALLALPDPQLAGYILAGHVPFEPDIAAVVTAIRNRAQA